MGLGARSEPGLPGREGAARNRVARCLFEYDQPGDYLLDLRATLKLGDQLFLRVVQWKPDFNRGGH